MSAAVQFEVPAVVPADPNANVADLLVERVRATPSLALFAVPEGAGWRDITAAEFQRQVIELAKGFVAAGIEPGDKVAFIARTTYEWSLVDFALFFAGAVMVPVYETSSAAQISWIVSDSGAIAVLSESEEHAARVAEVRDELPLVRDTWSMASGALDTLRAGGVSVDDGEIERRRGLAVGSDIATLIYTSGSTGRPKGCVLTHSNFVELARNSATSLEEVVNTPGASTLLFITTAHVFARFISILDVHAGVKTGHQPDTKQLLPALGSFQPTFLLAVPRVFEKVYNSAEQKAEAGGKGKIFRAAAATAVEHSALLQDGKKVPLLTKIKFALFDKLVYSKLREAMGGRVTYAVSGSAPLGPRLGHFFHSLGVTILEGYGLTETTAPATVSTPEKAKIGTVGPVLPGVGVRLAEDGEIEVRGINVFKEYWRNPEATAAAFDGDWFKTGDLGSFDDEGFLSITGRKKEIIVTAGGKNVAPAALEDPIRANPIVGQVVVVGDQKPFIAALVTLDPEMLPTWLANNGLPADMSLEEAAKNPKVRDEVQLAVDRANKSVSRAESIRKFTILPVEWTEGSGHLTPKMSIKRGVILDDFADAVDEIYTVPVNTTKRVARLTRLTGSGPRGRPPVPRSVSRRRGAPRGSEPGALAHLAHRRLAVGGAEAREVQHAVEVIGLVLQRLGEQPVALEHDVVAVEVDAGDARPRVAERVVPEAGHRQASLPHRLRLAAHFGEHRVQHVPDVAVDVVAEGAQRDTDLRRRDPRTTGQLDRVDEVGHESAHALVDHVDRCADGAEHGVAEEADLANGHQAATDEARRPSTTIAASSRAASRVSGCRSRNEIALPDAMCGS